MIPDGVTRIKAVTVSNGVVNVSFEGTKNGVCFTSMAELNEQIALAQRFNLYVQFMLQIAEHIKTDPSLASPAQLASRPFITDPVSLADVVID